MYEVLRSLRLSNVPDAVDNMQFSAYPCPIILHLLHASL